MVSPQSVVSPFKNSVTAEPERQKSEFLDALSSSPLSKGAEVTSKKTVLEDFIGVLEVFVHQARDIHNICIYHKQDVYAKICLVSDPEYTVSTKTINGGGKNPVFNENLSLNVRTVETSLKCEVWMLSRVKNYLEDQLLGFALVPLSEVVIANGKLEREFSMSSTDLFHSPAGFVQLSLSYSGATPEVMAIPHLSKSMVTNDARDSELCESLPSDFDRIEFPDPKIENENESMISEYFGIPGSTLETQKSNSLTTSDAEDHLDSEVGRNVVESFARAASDSVQPPKLDSPPSSFSTNEVASSGVPPPVVAAISHTGDNQPDSRSPNQEHVSALREKTADARDGESGSSGSKMPEKPLVTVNIEPEQNVVQQDIVDMYMKSMQQFTESLAKMKLPLDIDNEPTSSGNSSSEQKLQPSKNNNSRVYYGSRAFF